MRARHTDKGAIDLIAAAAFGLVHRGRDRRRQRAHVVDNALFHTARGFDSDTDDIDIFGPHLADDSAYLGGAYVDANYDFLSHASCLLSATWTALPCIRARQGPIRRIRWAFSPAR